MDIEKTKLYYQQVDSDDLCDCDYCKNYISEVKAACPKLDSCLDSLGVDIQKPFETIPLDPDESGYIEYIGVQYIVLGSMDDFAEQAVDGAEVHIADSHPTTGICEEHFVIELGPIYLKWAVQMHPDFRG